MEAQHNESSRQAEVTKQTALKRFKRNQTRKFNRQKQAFLQSASYQPNVQALRESQAQGSRGEADTLAAGAAGSYAPSESEFNSSMAPPPPYPAASSSDRHSPPHQVSLPHPQRLSFVAWKARQSQSSQPGQLDSSFSPQHRALQEQQNELVKLQQGLAQTKQESQLVITALQARLSQAEQEIRRLESEAVRLAQLVSSKVAHSKILEAKLAASESALVHAKWIAEERLERIIDLCQEKNDRRREMDELTREIRNGGMALALKMEGLRRPWGEFRGAERSEGATVYGEEAQVPSRAAEAETPDSRDLVVPSRPNSQPSSAGLSSGFSFSSPGRAEPAASASSFFGSSSLPRPLPPLSSSDLAVVRMDAPRAGVKRGREADGAGEHDASAIFVPKRAALGKDRVDAVAQVASLGYSSPDGSS